MATLSKIQLGIGLQCQVVQLYVRVKESKDVALELPYLRCPLLFNAYCDASRCVCNSRYQVA